MRAGGEGVAGYLFPVKGILLVTLDAAAVRGSEKERRPAL